VRNWDCGLANLPFASFTQNLAWVAVSLLAGALLACGKPSPDPDPSARLGHIKRNGGTALRLRTLQAGEPPHS